jgi:hypothetical protein
MVPIPKLFVLVRRLYNQKPQTPKYILDFSPSEDVFCSLETTYERRIVPEQKPFVSVRRLQK